MARVKLSDWLEPDKLILIEGWARDGLTDEQIAHNMGINRSTLHRWKKESEDFCNTLKKGKEVVDREVENALLKSALGFHYEEDHVTNKGEVVTVRKFQPPSNTAQIFWLKNRKQNEWRDKQQLEHTGKDDNPIQIDYVAEWGKNGSNED